MVLEPRRGPDFDAARARRADDDLTRALLELEADRVEHWWPESDPPRGWGLPSVGTVGLALLLIGLALAHLLA